MTVSVNITAENISDEAMVEAIRDLHKNLSDAGASFTTAQVVTSTREAFNLHEPDDHQGTETGVSAGGSE